MNQIFTYNWDNICNITDEDIVQANIEGKPICLEMENFTYFQISKWIQLPGTLQMQEVLNHLTKTKLCCQLSTNVYKSLADVDVHLRHNSIEFSIVKRNEILSFYNTKDQ